MPRVTEITNFNDHESFIHNNDRGVIFFGSEGCHHCHNMGPFVEELSEKYPNVAFSHVEVSSVDVDHVNGVPVFVGYKLHEPIDVVLGANKKSLVSMIETKLL